MDDVDLISRLPCDILISILSCLTIKQAMVTSVLSRRWEKLWNFYHGNFDIKWYRGLQSKECLNYARLVSKVLDTLELVADDGLMDSFTIHIDLCPINMVYVDRWIQFALDKRRVNKLKFDSTLYCRVCSHRRIQYNFPPLGFVIAHQRNIQALTSIHFKRVNVSCEIIEHFLANCPLLESLDLIESAKSLTHLRVSGEILALKYLQIYCCPYLTTIEIIFAPNIVSFCYFSLGKTNAKFYVGNAPKLVEFSFGGLETPPMMLSAHHLLTSFSSIQKLKLEIYSKEPGELIKLVELHSVKHFTMSICGLKCEHVLEWTPLLNAFPNLQKFTLDMRFREEEKIDGVWTRGGGDDDKFPSKCLEEFEFLGFGRSDDDIELVMYLLEKVSVQPAKILLRCDGGCVFCGCELWLDLCGGCERRAVSIASKLKQVIPQDINLLFLDRRAPSSAEVDLMNRGLL